MKRYLLVVVGLVCALAAASPAGAVILDETYLIGTVIDAARANVATELVYAQNLINLYNAGTTGPVNIGTESYTVWGDNIGDFGILTTEDLVGFKVNGGEISGFSLNLTGSRYLWAKFGGYGALYLVDGIDLVDGINTSGTQPASVRGGGLSHVTLIPEPGTLILLGSGLLGLVLMGGRKKFRK